MASTLQNAQDRVQRDLVDSERRQRQAAEKLARELAKVLQELAIIFDGDRLEALRREDPKVPLYWTPDNWRMFFAEVPSPVKEGWNGKDGPRVAELERIIAELKMRLETAVPAAITAQAAAPARLFTREDAEKSIKAGASEKSARQDVPPPAAFVVPEGMIGPTGNLLASAREIWKTLPGTCPADFQKMLSGGGRTGEDLKKGYQRSWLMLYLIGACGLNAKFEIEDLLAFVGGLASRPGSLGRIAKDMLKASILEGSVLRIGTPKTSLSLVRLSPDGIRLFNVLFGREPVETDWERLIRLHEGDRFPEHTLAVLIFSLHARKRGWATRILPPVEGTKAIPDLLVLHGAEKLYVEVELGQKESPTKWRNQAELNGHKVALCAATPGGRRRLVGDCHLDHLPGLATDLESLVKVKFQAIDETTPLWLEKW